MFRYVLAIMFFSFLFSCSEKKEEKTPDNILSEEKMSAVLIDMNLLEASASLSFIQEGEEQEKVPQIDIYKKHNITKKEFDESFKYYSSKPEKLNKIYEQVLNELNKMQAEAQNNKKP